MNKIILTSAIETSNTETCALTLSFVSYLNMQCCTSSIRQDVRGFLWSGLVLYDGSGVPQTVGSENCSEFSSYRLLQQRVKHIIKTLASHPRRL